MNYIAEDFLSERTAIVTGGSKRLGASISIELAKKGANIVILDRSIDENSSWVIDEIKKLGKKAIAIRGDVSNEQDVRKMIQRTMDTFHSIDILIHNAGPWTETHLKDLEINEWDQIMNGNLKGAFLTSKLVCPYMKENKRGKIIHLSAEGSFARNHTVYGLAKNGINTLTQSLALEFAPEITVNAISPGLLHDPGIKKDLLNYANKDTPLGRIATYEEVAHMIVMMCSPLFDIVTGQVIVMDGGRTILRYEHNPPE